jgi:hypothetical protein
MGESVSGLVSSRRGSLLFRKAFIIARLITITAKSVTLHAAGWNVSRYLPQESWTWNFLLRFYIVIPGNYFVIFLCDFSTRFMKVNACIWDRVCSHVLSLKFIHSFINVSTASSYSFYIDGRTPWTRDQPFARPLPTHRTTQTQNKRTHKHPYSKWNSNPRSQRSSGRRQFMP